MCSPDGRQQELEDLQPCKLYDEAHLEKRLLREPLCVALRILPHAAKLRIHTLRKAARANIC